MKHCHKSILLSMLLVGLLGVGAIPPVSADTDISARITVDPGVWIGGETWAVDVGTVVTLGANTSTSSAGISAYSWDISGTHHSNNATVAVDSSFGAVCDIDLMVSDSDGDHSTASVRIIFDSAPPVINITISGTYIGDVVYGAQGEFMFFNASPSTDDSMITNYTWCWDDGSISYGSSLEWIFLYPGVYDLTLTLTDPFLHNSSRDLKMMISDNVPPEPVIALTDSGGTPLTSFHVFQDVVLDASGSYDIMPPGMEREGLSYKWRVVFLGDRSIVLDNTSVWSAEDHLEARGLFDRPGRYEITLFVTDQFRNEEHTSMSVAVVGPDIRIISSHGNTNTSNVHAGDTVSITFRVENLGYGWEGDITLAVYLDNDEVGRGYINGLPAGGQTNCTVEFTPEKAGTFFFIVKLDPEDRVPGQESEAGVNLVTLEVKDDGNTFRDRVQVFTAVALLVVMIIVAFIAIRSQRKGSLREAGKNQEGGGTTEKEREKVVHRPGEGKSAKAHRRRKSGKRT